MERGKYVKVKDFSSHYDPKKKAKKA
jgi:hypothetical protein